MSNNYPFDGYVTLSTEEYLDLLKELNAAQRDSQMHLDAFSSVHKERDALKKELEELKAQLAREDDF